MLPDVKPAPPDCRTWVKLAGIEYDMVTVPIPGTVNTELLGTGEPKLAADDMSSQVTVTALLAPVAPATVTSADTKTAIIREAIRMELSFRALAPQGCRPQSESPAGGRPTSPGGRAPYRIEPNGGGKSAARGSRRRA